MSILDNLEAYLELEDIDHTSLSTKVFQETICKDCVATENSKN